jgi:hypothetical protein
MCSRSFNVTCITFAGFVLLDHFMSYLKHLLTPDAGAGSPSKAHKPLELYTKAAVKANPPQPRGLKRARGWNPEISTPAARRRFHLC